jgi:alginate O-acetyltransferase complex protein AlgI
MAQGLTFVFVSLAWVFFRADSVTQAGQIFQGLLASPAGVWPSGPWPWLELVAISGVLLVLSPWASTLEDRCIAFMRWVGALGTAVLLSLLVIAVIAFGPDGVPGFIYYRF